MEKFKNEVRDYYKSYYENGDKAHLIDHADDVCTLALKINQKCDEKLVILASYIHDMFNAMHRPTHNELAYEYVKKSDDKFLKELSKKERLEVANAVLEHRASFKGEFYSNLSEIISSADRGEPDLEVVVQRSMKFNGNAHDVYEHIKDKYGVNGYAKYPEVYRKIFKEELAYFQKEADEITVGKILEICNV
ncbi:MAG TPA: HD domain-containing protein [Campylobacterales bacterium]|nr:HD domain-containing protein [Campylobacterales bacterium]